MDNVNETTRNIKDLGNQHIQALYDLTEQHANDLRQLLSIILEDMIDSYDVLIQQREQSIDRYIKLISFLLQDEIDVSKPIQRLVEKKMNDVAGLKQEVAPIKELKYQLENDIENDDEFGRIIERIKNI